MLSSGFILNVPPRSRYTDCSRILEFGPVRKIASVMIWTSRIFYHYAASPRTKRLPGIASNEYK